MLSVSTPLPSAAELPFVSLAFSGLGLLFLIVGRREWNDLHLARVRYATVVFVATLAAVGAAVVPVALLVATGTTDPSSAVRSAFGGAVAAAFALGFATYAIAVTHLVGRPGEIAIGLGIGWAVVVSVEVGAVLARALGQLVAAAAVRSLGVSNALAPVREWDALLAFSYLAFFYAFTEAHHRVRLAPRPDLPL